MLRRASRPTGPVDAWRGTPIIGRGVLPAREPARCAAIPAAAIMTLMPFALALSAKSAAISGVRWAEMILTMGSMPKSFSWSTQLCIVGRSLSEPITTATVDFLFKDVIVFSRVKVMLFAIATVRWTIRRDNNFNLAKLQVWRYHNGSKKTCCGWTIL